MNLLPLLIPVTLLQQSGPWEPMRTPWVEPGYMKVVWIKSPNSDFRPADAAIDTIVVHSTVIPTLERTTVAFQRPESKVSAHFSIGKDGSIVQNVDTFERAWHAGVSKDVSGRSNLNHFSVGIELVNLNDGKDSYPDAQLDALKAIITVLIRRHQITQIVSHEYIAEPGGRKSDPTNFPWGQLSQFKLPLYFGQKKPS